jgi:hypothetical protein
MLTPENAWNQTFTQSLQEATSFNNLLTPKGPFNTIQDALKWLTHKIELQTIQYDTLTEHDLDQAIENYIHTSVWFKIEPNLSCYIDLTSSSKSGKDEFSGFVLTRTYDQNYGHLSAHSRLTHQRWFNTKLTSPTNS